MRLFVPSCFQRSWGVLVFLCCSATFAQNQQSCEQLWTDPWVEYNQQIESLKTLRNIHTLVNSILAYIDSAERIFAETRFPPSADPVRLVARLSRERNFPQRALKLIRETLDHSVLSRPLAPYNSETLSVFWGLSVEEKNLEMAWNTRAGVKRRYLDTDEIHQILRTESKLVVRSRYWNPDFRHYTEGLIKLVGDVANLQITGSDYTKLVRFLLSRLTWLYSNEAFGPNGDFDCQSASEFVAEAAKQARFIGVNSIDRAAIQNDWSDLRTRACPHRYPDSLNLGGLSKVELQLFAAEGI